MKLRFHLTSLCQGIEIEKAFVDSINYGGFGDPTCARPRRQSVPAA